MMVTFTGKQRNIREMIIPMIENEWGFDIDWPYASATILFCKGVWTIRCKRNEKYFYIELTDAPAIQQCENSILMGFIAEKISHAKEYATDRPCRSLPARVIMDTVELINGSADLAESILVHATKRNTYFNVDGNVMSSS